MKGLSMQSATRDKIVGVIDKLSNEYLKGKAQAVRLCFIALLSGGHILLEDIPGLGKTTLALVLANTLGLSFGRIQCTSDLLPSDITGLSIFNREQNVFKFIQGPIFNNIILVDEINRAMPKTQSAMLEAMEERRVTVEGVTYQLPEPFLVIATQNPVEQVGTYPLPSRNWTDSSSGPASAIHQRPWNDPSSNTAAFVMKSRIFPPCFPSQIFWLPSGRCMSRFIWQTILSVTFLPSLPLLAIIPSYCPAFRPEGELIWLMRPDPWLILKGGTLSSPRM